jgi:SAM-dependent MidA family methyltransferase
MQTVTTIRDILRREIHKSGVLPFARFMELALYCPDCGYYETKRDIGRRGDFYTSVSTGSLFGGMLAFQFAAWLEELQTLNPQPSTLNLIEAGAHDGQLANDILTWLRSNRPKLFAEIEYLILEPSAHRRDWQRETLKDFANVRWTDRFQSAPSSASHSAPRTPHWSGVLFSNELLDAFPVHRFGWDARNKKWFEWGVAVEGETFVWAKLGHSELPSSILNLPSSLLSVLPDGYILETSPAAVAWWREAAGSLARGKLLAIDYGFTGDELLSPSRTRGTLRAYFQHHAAEDLLANPGEQDLTAHVNFSAIQNAGEEAGLTTEFFGSQAKFLTEAVARAAAADSLGTWGPRQARQFQTLTHPEHLGRAFRVLVQSRRSS